MRKYTFVALLVLASVVALFAATATQTLSITVAPATLSITTTGLPGGQVNVAYPATQLQATGGVAPYTWSYTGSLPPGLALSSAGVISGTPTTYGTYSFNVTVTDASGTSTTVNALSKTTTR